MLSTAFSYGTGGTAFGNIQANFSNDPVTTSTKPGGGAGHNALRGSGPGQKPAFEDAAPKTEVS
jgi:hypothetical protein